MIVDSTNPRIMADNIRELARNGGGGGSDLPDVGPEDAGEVLMVSNVGKWEAAELPSSESPVKKVAIRTVSASTQSAIVSINGVEYSYTSQDFPVTVDGLTLEYLVNDFKWKVSSTKNVIYSGALAASLDDEWAYNEMHDVDYYVFN